MTIIDQPFNTRQITVYVDGVPYCQTPSIVCLDIDNQIIIDNHHHPDTVKQVFYGRYQSSNAGLEVCDNSNPSQYSTAWLYILHEAYLLVVCSKFTPKTQ